MTPTLNTNGTYNSVEDLVEAARESEAKLATARQKELEAWEREQQE